MKKFILLAFICLFALVGCTPQGNETESKNPQFESYSPENVTLTEDGGDFTISYTLTDKIEGETLDVIAIRRDNYDFSQSDLWWYRCSGRYC